MEDLAEEFGKGFSGTVVVPGDLKYQWRDFIAEFTGGTQDPVTGMWSGGSPCIVVDGRTPAHRDAQYKRAQKERPTYTIISYNQIVGDYNLVTKLLPWDFGVLDEVTYIKGFDSDRSQAMKTISPEFRYGLTGDPVETAPEDLFSIMEWVDPSVLGRWDIFDRTYCIRAPQGWLVKGINLDVLHEVMDNAGAWIVKSADDPDVAPFMPTRKPAEVIRVRLDEASAEVYELVAEELMADLAEMSRSGAGGVDIAAMYSGMKGAKGAHGRAAAKLMSLRMLCASPYVLRQSARRYLSAPEKPKKLTTINRRDGVRVKVMKAPPKPGSSYAASLMEAGWLTDLQEHPKIAAVVKRIDQILDENPNNKVVVFSFFKDVLHWLGAQYEGEHVLYYGSPGMNQKQRYAAKLQFQMDPDTRLFLSSDAGAYGTDLPQANYLINYDTPFSAGPKRQRDHRIIRGSSLKFWTHVQVIDVLVEGSIEEHYHDKTMRRMELGEAIKSGKRSTSEVKMTAMSLTKWIETHDV